MFRDLLSSRLIQVGLVFFVVVVGGSLLYSWHVHRTTVAEFARTDVVPHQTRSEQDTVDTSTVDFEQAETPLEADDSQMSDDTDVAPIDETSEMLNMADAFLPDDFVSEEEPATDMPVSPFGFGPFPEVPVDYPDQGTWSEERLQTMQPDHELLSRVRIKLWNQGIHTVGAVYDSEYRLIYPILDDVVYYKETYGANDSVTRRALTSSATDDKYGYDLLEGIIDPHLTVYYFPDGGIDPYDFLDLPR